MYLNRVITLAFIIIITFRLNAQYVQPMGFLDYSMWDQMNIGNKGAKRTDPSAYLELGKFSGSKRGLLLPRGNKDSLENPVRGLLFYDIPSNDIWYYNGTDWIQISTGGSDNSNAGAFFRWLKPSSQELKTLAVGYGTIADSTTNTDAITITTDTSVIASKAFANNSYASKTGSNDYIQNQFALSQVVQAWLNKLRGDTLIVGTFVTNPSIYFNGQMWYNSTDGKIKVVENGAIKNAVDNSVSGKIILVDKDNTNATDTRTGLSKYNQDYPWKTINAALASVVSGDNVMIMNGTYSEIVAFPGSFPNGITVTISNATVLSWTSHNVGFTISGLGNANVDTIYYGNGAVYSGLTRVKAFIGAGGSATAFVRNVYSIDSVAATAGLIEFYNVNNIRTVRIGAQTKFYNCRIISTTGAGIAVRSTSSVIVSINNVAFIECYIEGSVYAFDLAGLGTKLKMIDCEIVGGTHAIFGGSGSGIRTSQIRAINTVIRSNTGNNTISAGHANSTFDLELSNTTRSGTTAALGTVNYLLQNNDIIYSGL